MDSQSVSFFLQNLKGGDHDAARELWDRYFQQLLSAARKRLGSVPRRVADEDDVAQSVFLSLCRGAAQGRFPKLDDRNDLWQVLLVLTRDKVVGQIRRNTRQKRGGGDVRGDSVFCKSSEAAAGFDQILNDKPGPEFLAALNEEFCHLMDVLPDNLRQVALLRFEGYTNEEIAEQIGMTTRSIERKLRLIRDRWTTELD